MVEIKLTDKEYRELQGLLWMQNNTCESAQEPTHEDYDEEYAKTMLSIYKKFKV